MIKVCRSSIIYGNNDGLSSGSFWGSNIVKHVQKSIPENASLISPLNAATKGIYTSESNFLKSNVSFLNLADEGRADICSSHRFKIIEDFLGKILPYNS